MQRVLVLGATGMLGHVFFKQLGYSGQFEVAGTVRSRTGLEMAFTADERRCLYDGVDAEHFDSLIRVFGQVRPHAVLNCIGIIKQLPSAKDPMASLSLNALFPHRLARLCEASGSRLIHVSTDCVFRGDRGNYRESDTSDADDLYGRTKFLGELHGAHCLTLRTSVIGHELTNNVSLVDWFLSQNGRTRGYTKAIYTGLSTIEMAELLIRHVLPNERLNGLYQVSSTPIAKYDLLRLIAARYGKVIEIEPFAGVAIDRSLDSTRFREQTGYLPPAWPDMVARMYEHFRSEPCYHPKRQLFGL